MKLRHLAPALLAAAALGCSPSVPSNPNTFIVTAQFDPTAAILPLPNSLVLDPRLNPTVLFPRNAQEELLATFYTAGGFPADQVTPVNFPIAALTVNGPNDVASAAPDLDMTSIVPCTGRQAPGGCNLIVIDALAPAAQQFPSLAVRYTKGATNGNLSVTPVENGAPVNWRPGATYFYALRGATTQGIRSAANVPLQPSPTTYLLLFGQPSDFACPPTNPDCSLKALKDLQLAYQPVFATIQNKGFPLSETVVVGTFTVAPATTWVVADPGTGTVPLPSNFMLDPVTGKVSTAVEQAFGVPGLSTLDGFSTTAAGIAQTSGPVKAGSVFTPGVSQGVFVYELGGTSPAEVHLPVGLAAPDVIGFQPATTIDLGAGPMVVPPLKERTQYAVLVTNRVTDPSDIPLSNTTLGQMLLFVHPLCTPSPACASSPTTATSAIPGVDGATASLLESMRLALQPAVSKLATDHGVARADIVMPYVFRTQTIASPAVQLGAAPYAPAPGTTQDAFPAAPVNVTAVTPADMAVRWGVPAALLPTTAISKFIEADVLTFDKLDPTTGAFRPVASDGVIAPIPAILALPATPPPATGWPLVVFHHGLGRSRGDVLFIAQALAGNGMAVVAVDAAKHGARAWCTKNTQTGVSTGCATGSTCDTTPFAQQPGDPATARPGLCTGGNLALLPIGCDPTTQPTCWNGARGNSATSGAFVISGNLFRSRDTVRQDILDQSMVVRVMTSQAGQAALASVAGAPFLLDPTKVYYVGQSLGAIEGTLDVAANPRISKAVLNVGGATILDILTTSPSPGVGGAFLAALASLGITPGTEQFLLFTIAAKWILDPADPANFAQNLVAAPLPNLLVDPTGQTPQAAKAVLGQAARCDGTVPNPTNQLLYGLVGLHPIAPLTADPAPSLQWFMSSSSAGACPVGAASHGFLLDWSVPAMATAGQANVVAYLLGGPVSPSPVVVP